MATLDKKDRIPVLEPLLYSIYQLYRLCVHPNMNCVPPLIQMYPRDHWFDTSQDLEPLLYSIYQLYRLCVCPNMNCVPHWYKCTQEITDLKPLKIGTPAVFNLPTCFWLTFAGRIKLLTEFDFSLTCWKSKYNFMKEIFFLSNSEQLLFHQCTFWALRLG